MNTALFTFGSFAVGPSDVQHRLRRTLLVVDDEEGPRQALSMIFREDYDVLLASSGMDAIALLRDHMVDAAVLDIRMGGMNGIELLERLKAVDPTIEVIMLTAYETIETMRQALRFGACDYLTKPFDLNIMRASVSRAMERRSLSEEIRSNHQKLSALQLDLQKHALQVELSKEKGQIHASIVHDINGPMTIISGFIQLIDEKLAQASTVEGPELDLLKDRLKRINRQVTNCIEISQRYLSFIRHKAKSESQIQINQVLGDLNELLKGHPSAKGMALKIQTLDHDLALNVNGTDLLQILLNLSVNALQATDLPHEVIIVPEAIYEVIDLNGLLRGKHDRVINAEGMRASSVYLKISVIDNGPGMSSDILSKLFIPYFTTKKIGEGTGLGLSIVQRLVREAQGGLYIHSAPDQGTRFSLFLALS
ncbi:MAG: Response regulator receiver sensor signal transduction histidine kinase [Verrucomicrobiales bacterium]|nr:Response regulator receiver sensor signal transduction histidine kinase [Verrucomicrobiales bacterium]